VMVAASSHRGIPVDNHLLLLLLCKQLFLRHLTQLRMACA
jgi:hypothetical protein